MSARAAERAQEGLQKGLWNRLRGALPGYLRERGDLDPSVYAELPSENYEHHPLLEELCCALPFAPLGSVVTVKRRRHINVGEVRAALRAESATGNRCGPCRYLHILDSQVAAACLMKGRSASSGLNFELRRSLALHLSQGTVPPSNDPTRDVELRKPSRPLPSWWQAAAERGDFEEFDAWLTSIGMHLDQLRELPPEEELLPDAPLGFPAEDPRRLDRRRRDPEAFAASKLGNCFVSAADLAHLFWRLPVETVHRSVMESRKGTLLWEWRIRAWRGLWCSTQHLLFSKSSATAGPCPTLTFTTTWTSPAFSLPSLTFEGVNFGCKAPMGITSSPSEART